MSKSLQIYLNRRHELSEKGKALAAAALAQKIGYLRIDDLGDAGMLEDLPVQSFSPHRVIRCKDQLLLIKEGVVEIWHTYHDYMVKELKAGVLFGELNLLGQTMLGTRAIVGSQGARLAVVNANVAKEWIRANPVLILERLGGRLADVEVQHYRSSFQMSDSRVAALLLELAGERSTVQGFTHDELGAKVGVYRETITNVLDAMKFDKLIKVGRKKLTILNKKALRELSEL